MKNVLALIRTDLRSLFANTVATIVTIGLIIVPPMYAWLTTLGFWNPYGNTDGLSVAVANEDAGYSSALFPSRVDVGATIVGKLHENGQFHWVFCTADEAEEGVKSGEYYAAIVIPENFSADLMSVMSPDEKTPELMYYVNQKENAIASHVTATGASVLQTQISQSFAQTVAEAALTVMHDLSQFMSADGLARYGSALAEQLRNTDEALDACVAEAEGVEGALAITRQLLDATSSILENSASLKGAADALGTDATASLDEAAAALEGASATASQDIQSADDALGRVQDAINGALDTVSSDPAYARQLIADASAMASSLAGAYAGARDELAGLGASTDAVTSLDAAIQALDSLSTELSAAAGDVDAAASTASAERDAVNQKLDEARAQVQAVDASLAQDLGTKTAALKQALADANASTEGLAATASDAAGAAGSAAGGLADSLTDAEGALEEATALLAQAKDSVHASLTALEGALASGDMEEVRAVLGSNPGSLASFIAAPTELVRHAVFEVPTNGDSMSPFYSSLALWVGAIFLIALANVNVSREEEAGLTDARPWQLYLGRYGAFLAVALAQALVLFVGNVFFLQVQCEHPLAYLGTLLLSALVFSNLVYTLNLSFGNVGKAIAIILLVMQLAGTGGIMPIQTSAPLFQALYPWLPFTHAISALASCMSGVYGDQLAVSLGCLAAFLVPSLLLGLALRIPMIRANAFIQQKLDETKLI